MEDFFSCCDYFFGFNAIFIGIEIKTYINQNVTCIVVNTV